MTKFSLHPSIQLLILNFFNLFWCFSSFGFHKSSDCSDWQNFKPNSVNLWDLVSLTAVLLDVTPRLYKRISRAGCLRYMFTCAREKMAWLIHNGLSYILREYLEHSQQFSTFPWVAKKEAYVIKVVNSCSWYQVKKEAGFPYGNADPYTHNCRSSHQRGWLSVWCLRRIGLWPRSTISSNSLKLLPPGVFCRAVGFVDIGGGLNTVFCVIDAVSTVGRSPSRLSLTDLIWSWVGRDK